MCFHVTSSTVDPENPLPPTAMTEVRCLQHSGRSNNSQLITFMVKTHNIKVLSDVVPPKHVLHIALNIRQNTTEILDTEISPIKLIN